MSTVLESRELKKAHSISSRVDEVSEEVLVELEQGYRGNLQSVVAECAALASQCAVVSYFSNSILRDNELDYRRIGEILKPAADKTSLIFADVEKLVGQASGETPRSDRSDLTMAMIEAKNVGEWLKTWPTHNRSRRSEARQAIDRNDLCDDSELLS